MKMKNAMIALVVLCVGGWVMSASAQLPEHFAVTVDKGGGTMVELNLSKYSIRSADFRVMSWSTNDGYVVETPPVRTYRGYVTENPNELVTAIIDVDNTLDATVHNGSGRLWTVGNVDVSSLLGGGPAPALPTTGIPTSGPVSAGSGDQAPPEANMPPVDMYSAHGVYDIPSSVYKGSVDATLAWLEYQWNIHDFFNSRDAKLNILLTEVIVRKEQFYTPANGDWSAFNSALRTEWLAQGQNARGFIASAFPSGFSYAGGYAVGNNFYVVGGEPICINALYHENAHNWGASHWYYGQDTMSGSHPAHGEMNVAKVLNNRAREITEATPGNGVELTTNAVSLVHPYAYSDLVTTLTNSPVDIAPLANDWDANGETLSIKYFTASTVQGGTVTQSGNVLTYTPAASYVGKDMVIYEVQDSTGLYTEEVIHIEVVNRSLAAHWAFEDASGQIATDGSGNGHSGTLDGASFGSDTVSGPVGNALSLAAGQTMVCNTNDLIAELEDAYPLDEGASNFFDPMDESFTATCWFRLDDATQTATLFTKRTPGHFGYILTAGSGGISTTVRMWDAIGSSYTVAGGEIYSDAWYHAAMVINRADHSLRLYLNGVEVGTAATLPADQFVFDGRDDLVMGGAGPVDLDEAQIHTKALSLAEIQVLHALGSVSAGGPRPAMGAVNQSIGNTVLEWVPGHASYQHDVYFGTNAAAVATATPVSPEHQGQQAEASFDPGTLDPTTTYFWRIDEVDGGTIIPGTVWSFSTAYSELLSDLVLHLTMDNDDVQTADGVTHTYDDIAVPAQDFDVFDATPGIAGKIGEAVDLTGTDDTLRSYAANPVVRPATGGMTISFWINTTSTQNGGEKVYDMGGAIFLRYYNGDLQPIFDGSSGGATIFDANINDGSWHHIVARNDGAGLTTLYVDGAVAGTQSEGLHDVASLNRTAALGSSYDSTGENLVASFDDFAVWQRALQVSEIAGIHTSGLAGQTFNNEPVLVNTSFEIAEGFSGFTAGGTEALGIVTDNDGVVWTELNDVDIWNRSDIPPAGIQTLTLGLNSTTPGCQVQIPGATHGVGLVTFDYAAFSSGSDTDFSLHYNDNAGSGWVEVWTTHMSGMDPAFGTKPWRTVEVAVNVPGDVDLKFAASGSKGPMIDNMRVTGSAELVATTNPPSFFADPFSASQAFKDAAYSDTIEGSASDPDVGNTLTYSKEGGPDWLVVSTNGALSGTPDAGDTGPNSFTVRVTDQGDLWDEATLEIDVVIGFETDVVIQNHSFEDGPAETGVPVGWTQTVGSATSLGAGAGGSHGSQLLWIGPDVAIRQDLSHTLAEGEVLTLQYESSRGANYARRIQLLAKNGGTYQLMAETTEQTGSGSWPTIQLDHTVAAQYHGHQLALQIVGDDTGDPDTDDWNEFDNFRISSSLVLYDSDGDGMTDNWEIANSLNPNLDDTTGNPDGDAYNNWFEYVTDTLAQDGDSFQTFSVEIDPGTGEPTVRFSSSAARNYAVEYRDDLTSGDWQSDPAFPGDGTEMTISDSASLTNRYYRLQIELP